MAPDRSPWEELSIVCMVVLLKMLNLDQFMRKNQRKAVQGTFYKIACILPECLGNENQILLPAPSK